MLKSCMTKYYRLIHQMHFFQIKIHVIFYIHVPAKIVHDNCINFLAKECNLSECSFLNVEFTLYLKIECTCLNLSFDMKVNLAKP